MPEELATINYMNRVVQLEKPVCISLVHSINYTYFLNAHRYMKCLHEHTLLSKLERKR